MRYIPMCPKCNNSKVILAPLPAPMGEIAGTPAEFINALPVACTECGWEGTLVSVHYSGV